MDSPEWGVPSVVAEEDQVAAVDAKTRLPLWVSNLLVFGFLFAVVVSYFYWQTHTTRDAFVSRIKSTTQLVASIIQLNARGAILSRAVSEEMLQTFLGNTARFIDYLDKIEPFSTEELTAFAKETRLVGIYISRNNKAYVEGPAQWSKNLPHIFDAAPSLKYDLSTHLYIFSWPRLKMPGWVMIGVEAAKIESLQKQLGLPSVIETITSLPGINYVKAAPVANIAEYQYSPDSPAVTILDSNNAKVAEAKTVIDNTELTVGLDAAYLTTATNRLWRDFFIFSTVLVFLGILLSYILYRQQSLHIEQIQAFERKISAEKQDATLGKAAAAIAHEIRNPLNSLSMGLQRLHLEAKEITPEHRHLIEIMLDAVQRTNGIVTNLLHYAAPQNPKQQIVQFDQLVENLLHLYQSRCTEQKININQNITFRQPLSGDPDLLRQVVENLLKNAIEAQPHGGFLNIEVGCKGQHEVAFVVSNGGFTLPPEQAERITEPYFTTKPTGTGLGLAIARRIVAAHKGRIKVSPLPDNAIEIAVFLPFNSSANS